METKANNFSINEGDSLKFQIKFNNLYAPIKDLVMLIAPKWGDKATVKVDIKNEAGDNTYLAFVHPDILKGFQEKDLVYAIHASFADEIATPFKGKIYIKENVNE